LLDVLVGSNRAIGSNVLPDFVEIDVCVWVENKSAHTKEQHDRIFQMVQNPLWNSKSAGSPDIYAPRRAVPESFVQPAPDRAENARLNAA
jgi:hypothetical protein